MTFESVLKKYLDANLICSILTEPNNTNGEYPMPRIIIHFVDDSIFDEFAKIDKKLFNLDNFESDDYNGDRNWGYLYYNEETKDELIESLHNALIQYLALHNELSVDDLIKCFTPTIYANKRVYYFRIGRGLFYGKIYANYMDNYGNNLYPESYHNTLVEALVALRTNINTEDFKKPLWDEANRHPHSLGKEPNFFVKFFTKLLHKSKI